MSVQSPCIGTCRINVRSGLCEGCYRTEEEIKSWGSLPDDDRRRVVCLVEQRQAESVRFD